MTDGLLDTEVLAHTTLSTRTWEALRRQGVLTVGELRMAHARVGYLTCLPGFGRKALREVEDLLGVAREKVAPTDELIDATREYRASLKRYRDLGARFSEAERELDAAVTRFDAARRAAEDDVIRQQVNLRPVRKQQ